jgi:hypothetical protein
MFPVLVYAGLGHDTWLPFFAFSDSANFAFREGTIAAPLHRGGGEEEK